MAINLERATFSGMDEELKKEVKKDVSKFGLFLGDEYGEVRITKPHEDTNLIVLNCGHIVQFEYPKGSKNQKFENGGKKGKRFKEDTEVDINFNYHNKFYRIYGLV
jgi:hypothetical protein